MQSGLVCCASALGLRFLSSAGALGRFWGILWRLSGCTWALLAASWPFFGHSKSSFFRALAQDRLQDAFWIDFWWILGGSGRIWRGFGRVLGGFGGYFPRIFRIFLKFGCSGKKIIFLLTPLGKFCGHLEKCGPAAAKLINWTPALIREASQCAGVLYPYAC